MDKKPILGTLTQIAEAKDELDNFILNRIGMNFGMNLSSGLHINEKQKEDYFGKILNCTLSLLKVNECKRSYVEKEKKLIEEFRKKAIGDANKSIILGEKPIELLTEADSFFTQIKSALDSLAQILNPFFGISIDGWHKAKYKGVEKSGVRILNTLNNLNEEERKKTVSLRVLIEESLDWLTYLVQLRDNPLHKGSYAGNIIEMKIVKSENQVSDVYPLCIRHPCNIIEPLSNFLNRTIHDVASFVEAFLYHSLQCKSFGGLTLHLVKEKEGEVYRWAIPQIKKTGEEKEKNQNPK